MSQRLAGIWFRKRVHEAEEAARLGKRTAAIDLLWDLVEQCHRESRSALSQWHEIQALWLLGVELEALGRDKEAAYVYGRILRMRRAALAEASEGVASSVAAAAVCELRAGNRTRGLRLGVEALRLHDAHPMSAADKQVLEGMIEKARQRSKRKGQRLNEAPSNNEMQLTRSAPPRNRGPRS